MDRVEDRQALLNSEKTGKEHKDSERMTPEKKRPPQATVHHETLSLVGDGRVEEIVVGSSAWFRWLARASRFVLVAGDLRVPVRREQAGSGRGQGYWRAYYKRRGVVQRVYLGSSEELTRERLQAAATTLGALASRDTVASTEARVPALAPLQMAKLFVPPPRPGLVPRTALLARLDRAQTVRLTVLVAPAGFGKTTVLSGWAASRPDLRVAWLSLDAADNEPLRFLRYLVAALRRVAPDWDSRTAVLLGQPSPPPPHELLPLLLAELANFPPTTLVLDDYHLVSEPAIHQMVTTVLAPAALALHLILASRNDVPLALGRLRASGGVSTIRTDTLRFSLDEASVFLRDTMGVELAPAQVASLVARTEGWAAGLQLAALALQDRSDPAAFIAGFDGTHAFVIDYLVGEVLARLPASTVRFLLHTAIVERVSGSLADALLEVDQAAERGAGQALLESLEQANLFVVPLDEHRQWYRYHRLFGEMLRQRLLQQEGTAASIDLHLRASAWFEKHGLLPEAITHALAAGASEQAAELIERAGRALLSAGGGHLPLAAWLAALPPELVARRAQLGLFRVMLHFERQEFAAAEQALQHAEHALAHGEPSSVTPLIREDIALARLLIDTFADRIAPEQLSARAEKLVRHLEALSPPLRSALMSAQTAVYLAQGNYAEAARVSGEIAALNQREGNDYLTLIARGQQLDVQRAQGLLGLTEGACRSTLAWARERGLHHTLSATLSATTLVELLCERHALAEAAAIAVDELVVLLEQGTPGQRLLCVFPLARLALLQGEEGRALRLVQEAQQELDGVWRDDLLPLLAGLEARILLARGATKAALAPAALTHAALPQRRRLLMLSTAYGYEYGPLVHAEAMLAHGCALGDRALVGQAQAYVVAQQQTAIARNLPWFQIKTQTLQAVAHEALGSSRAATEALGAALGLAAPDGYVRAILDNGPSVLPLLRRVRRDRSTHDHLRRLLRIAEGRDTGKALVAAEGVFASSPAGQLTKRELDVVQLLAAGLSNPDIAARLIISQATVKKHMQNIFRKLGVHNRLQAVTQARNAGLLDGQSLKETGP
ncbi:MAG TPA: LuxR C-terminal-related transcriptional regulator [Roseiflexaceae bacterium]|nr:LuxR C-terminal-related transcriptional regulator [Roseiflexaceae bacterium]